MLLFAYRLVAYASFVASFSAFILAATGLALAPPIDGRARLAWPAALAVDVGLVLLFAVQHTMMARPWFKRALARLLPPSAERSTYVLASSACIAAIALGWAPIEGDVWRMSGLAGAAMTAVSLVGWVFAGASTFAFDHLALFGLREARGEPVFTTPLLYRLVRHPMMLGLLVAFWAAPRMTIGHLVFALALTGYVVVGVRYEERGLEQTFPEEYPRYRARVPALLPWPRPSG